MSENSAHNYYMSVYIIDHFIITHVGVVNVLYEGNIQRCIITNIKYNMIWDRWGSRSAVPAERGSHLGTGEGSTCGEAG